MQATRRTIEIGEQTFGLRWDMNAIATFERLTGESVLLGDGIKVTAGNMLALLWSCIDADAASRDEDPPISFRRFGSLLQAGEDMTKATQAAIDLIAENAPPGKANRATRRAVAKKASRSPGSTSSRRSTSASANGSSGD